MALLRLLPLLLSALLFISCQEPFDPVVSFKVFSSNPLIDSTALVTVAEVRDPVTFTILVMGSSNGAQPVWTDTFTVRVIGVDVFDAAPGDSLQAQADRAGIPVDSAMELGRASRRFADSVLRSVRLYRDPARANMDGGGRFLRYVTVVTGYDAVSGQAIVEDYAQALRSRRLAIP